MGSWVKMTFDAKVERCGIVWFRVKDGLGKRGDREDWVANIPHICVSVHDYQWNGDEFGANHGSFDNACIQELKSSLAGAIFRLKEQERGIANLRSAIQKLSNATKMKL